MARPMTWVIAGIVITVALAIVGVVPRVEAQTPSRPARVGYLAVGSLEAPELRQRLEAIRRGLRERGYVEGQNLVMELRGADGNVERLPALARDLLNLKLDVIVAAATPAALAAKQTTTTVPIVAIAMGDPIRDGLVVSLNRPGANVTGSTFLGPELVPKRLEILKEALPRVSRVAVLWHHGAFSERTTSDMVKETKSAARRLGLHLQLVGVRGPEEIDGAFVAAARERAEAFISFPSAMLFGQVPRLVALAAKHRIPAMFNAVEFVELGGLFAYGASLGDLNYRGGLYAGQILKGARPADLPVEQPTSFEFAVNLKTAKTLGVTVPPSLVLRASRVIE